MPCNSATRKTEARGRWQYPNLARLRYILYSSANCVCYFNIALVVGVKEIV